MLFRILERQCKKNVLLSEAVIYIYIYIYKVGAIKYIRSSKQCPPTIWSVFKIGPIIELLVHMQHALVMGVRASIMAVH